jgi:hypothetical protein
MFPLLGLIYTASLNPQVTHGVILKNPIYTVIPVTPPGAGWWHLLPPSCQLLAPTAITPAYSG